MAATQKQRSILVINPNTTQSMTDGLKPLIDSLRIAKVWKPNRATQITFSNTLFRQETLHVQYYTAPSGVPSINNEADAAISAQTCISHFLQTKILESFDAFLVCCYSQHPLVPALRQHLAEQNQANKAVTGIFEASVAASLQSINVDEKFGIVSTGKQWEGILGEAVANLLGSPSSARYAGTETTGLNATELHTTPKSEVDKRMKDATKRLLAQNAKAICLGCAGMAGMDMTVREACVEHLGREEGSRIRIIDGVISGFVYLDGILRVAS